MLGTVYSPWHSSVPVHRAGMTKSPVDGNPARQPWLHPQIFRTRGVPVNFKHIKILPSENVPVAIQKRAAQMFRERFQRAAILRVIRVDRTAIDPLANKFAILWAIVFRPLEPRPPRPIHPQRLRPPEPVFSSVLCPRHT